MAIVVVCVISWVVYDFVMVKRAADQVAVMLQSRTEPFYNRLSLIQRKELNRRARALRPVRISIGNFADVSLEVLVNMWDEVLNKLLFLLS